MVYIPLPKAGFVKIGGITITVVSILFLLTSTYSPGSLTPGKYSAPGSSFHHGDSFSNSDNGVIPNLVHYVHIMPDSPSGDIKFGLKDFISIYSALLHFQPDSIYLHTDASETSIERAKDGPLASAPNKWAHLILNLPSVVVERISAPTTASGSGVAIAGLEHKSDFVRAEAVYKHGGMYLDFDVYALRDIKPLRKAGFANVLGRQKLGQINSGCWMSQKGSVLMKMWVEGQNKVYDGKWTTHSNILLTSLSESLVPKEGGDEILILDIKSFAPSSWEIEDATELFEEHPRGVVRDTSENGSAATNNDTLPWEIDYSPSYVIHAFKAPGNNIANFHPEGITMRYLLAQQSNFARAVYPAVKHAVDAGIISADD